MVGTTMQFIEAARRIAVSNQGPRIRGTNLVATALAEYFQQGLNDGSISDHGGLITFDDLLNHLYDAWLFFANDPSNDAILFREQYERELQRQPVDLLRLSGGENRLSDIGLLDKVIAKIVELAWHTPRPEGKVSNYFLAADVVLKQELQRFVRSVYLQGMIEMIADNECAGMSGVFGSTCLQCVYVESESNIHFDLSRVSTVYPGGFAELTFVIKDEEANCSQVTQKSTVCDLATGIGMVDDVITRWPLQGDPDHGAKRRELFKADLNITAV